MLGCEVTPPERGAVGAAIADVAVAVVIDVVLGDVICRFIIKREGFRCWD